MGRLKVLFITTWYPTQRQPIAGVFVREHAKAVQLYDDVIVLHCAGLDSNLTALWRVEQETDSDFAENVTAYRVWHRRSPIPKTSYPIYIWSVFQAYNLLAHQDFRPDIIHAHLYKAGVPAVLIGKKNGVPVVITEHSTEFPRRMLRALDIWKARVAFNRADVVMPVSHSLQRAIEAYGIRARFQVVPNVVDTQRFHPPPAHQLRNQDKRMLAVSLLDASHKKGIPQLLEALVEVRDRRDDWQLDIVGDGPARSEYEVMARDLGLAERITFHGIRPRAEVAQFMRQADFFVLPSLWENLPCVLIEAMASGLPIVATHVGGIPEMVDDEIGILVPPGDAKSLSVALCSMLESVDEFDRQAIVQRSDNYSPGSVGKLLHSIYQECVGK
jgi:glycosyltransferase involved in cell wall biosynthesis